MKLTEQELKEKFSRKNGQSIEEYVRFLHEYKDNCSKNRDLIALSEVYRYDTINGSAATLVYDLPAFSYLCGRLHDADSLKDAVKRIDFLLMMHRQYLDASIRMANELYRIGWFFPNISNEDMDYLEKLYCDRDWFEMMDVIMCDIDTLPRQIKKFDKNLFSKKNDVFSEELLDTVYRFLEADSEELQEHAMYDRFTNTIRLIDDYSYNNEEQHRGEFYVEWQERASEFYSFMNDTFGEDCCKFFLAHFNEEQRKRKSIWGQDRDFVENFAENEFEVFSLKVEVRVLDKYFQTPEERKQIRRIIANYWLKKVNEMEC